MPRATKKRLQTKMAEETTAVYTILLSETLLLLYWISVAIYTADQDALHGGATVHFYGATLRGLLHFGTVIITALVYNAYRHATRKSKSDAVPSPKRFASIAAAFGILLMVLFDLFCLVGAIINPHPVTAPWKCIVAFQSWSLANSFSAMCTCAFIWYSWRQIHLGSAQKMNRSHLDIDSVRI